MEKIAALETPYTVDVELGDGRKIRAHIYVASMRVHEREGPSIIAAFKEAKTVIGVQALEVLGLKVDPTTGKLEPARPKGLALLLLVNPSTSLSDLPFLQINRYLCLQ